MNQLLLDLQKAVCEDKDITSIGIAMLKVQKEIAINKYQVKPEDFTGLNSDLLGMFIVAGLVTIAHTVKP